MPQAGTPVQRDDWQKDAQPLGYRQNPSPAIAGYRYKLLRLHRTSRNGLALFVHVRILIPSQHLQFHIGSAAENSRQLIDVPGEDGKPTCRLAPDTARRAGSFKIRGKRPLAMPRPACRTPIRMHRYLGLRRPPAISPDNCTLITLQLT
jgi:hypothetical protein